MEGVKLGEKLLPLGINLCAFDFSGSGNSQGDWTTHGYKEKSDLKAVVNYLKENKNISQIGLWGRGLGASTALFYMKENPGTVNCAVMDSGFSSLQAIMPGLVAESGLSAKMVD